MRFSAVRLISCLLVLFALIVQGHGCATNSSNDSFDGSADREHGNGSDEGIGLDDIEEELSSDDRSSVRSSGSSSEPQFRLDRDLSGGFDIEDSKGVNTGRLKQKPGGGYTIENSIGQEIGEIEPNPAGGYDIENSFGRDVGKVERNHRGGYDIKDPLGRDVKRVETNAYGGYDIAEREDQ